MGLLETYDMTGDGEGLEMEHSLGPFGRIKNAKPLTVESDNAKGAINPLERNKWGARNTAPQ